ncbi:MAG: tRNA epoxyqueuosine(34) reductase QueG [Anaerolineales bacterium]|jgi:epoxyqueuosine reductase
MSLQNKIAAEVKRLGFTLFGVTVPGAPPHFNVYESWIKQGRHGGMGYLATERAMSRRSDPGLILPGCKSILVLGWPHLIPNLPVQNLESESYRLTGRIASYAWDEDYHEVIPRKMNQLVDFIEQQVGGKIPNRWYTDTGPILERDLAQQAGLGWIGKNSCLINPGSGSYFLLAELFLGIKLEADQPFSADRCGSCTRCIQACPTGCIIGDRTIDASRCISYLTIELKGAIPVELRPQIQNWVFGCDICQQVCPWNQRFAAPTESIQVDVHLAQLELISELALSPQAFNIKFKGSPVKRTKRRGYLRNVAVALGNSGSTSGVPRLIETLKNDQEPLVRGHAAWALGRIGNQQARYALETALSYEHDPYVLEEIHSGLGG